MNVKLTHVNQNHNFVFLKSFSTLKILSFNRSSIIFSALVYSVLFCGETQTCFAFVAQQDTYDFFGSLTVQLISTPAITATVPVGYKA